MTDFNEIVKNNTGFFYHVFLSFRKNKSQRICILRGLCPKIINFGGNSF